MKNTVKVNFTIPQKILLFLALIETTFYSVGEYEFMRGELKKIKILFTGMVGPYREIFLSVLKTARGLEKYFSIRTSNPVNNIYIPFYIFKYTYLFVPSRHNISLSFNKQQTCRMHYILKILCKKFSN